MVKEKRNSWAELLMRLLGFQEPSLSIDEQRVMIKSRKFF